MCSAKVKGFIHLCCAVLSRVRLFATPWTVASQAPLSLEFFRQEYWSGLPFLSPGDLPDPGIKPVSLMSSALAVGFFTISATFSGKQIHASKRVLDVSPICCFCRLIILR